MGTNVQAGQLAVAGQGTGQANQYYGVADVNQTTVLAATAQNLSTVYTIPAGEAYATAAYELSCGGTGTWGGTQQLLKFQALLGTQFGNSPQIAAAALPASAAFSWMAVMKVISADGVSNWWGSLSVWLQETANALNPGTAADNCFAMAASNSAAHAATVSANITVAVQALWGATTGAPTITNSWTTFRKIS